MSWGSAKTWLIIVFLVLDLLLGWQYWQSRQEATGYTESYSDLVANTKTLLAAHNFSLSATVPQDHADMPSLQTDSKSVPYQALAKTVFPGAGQVVIDERGGDITTDTGQLRVEDINTWKVDYSAPFKASDTSGKGILNYVWQGSQYHLDKALTSGEFRIFDQYYHDRPLFDATVMARQTDGLLDGYEQTLVTNITEVSAPKPTISALDALASLANSVDKSGTQQDNVIEHIELGYAVKASSKTPGSYGDSSAYWFPVWRIVTASGQVYYINAFTGEMNSGL